MLSEREKLDTLICLGIELNQINDIDILMERVLSYARQFVNADAGSIYIRHNDSLYFTYTQNETLSKRLSEKEKLIYSYFSIPINKKSIAGYVAKYGNLLNIDNVYNLSDSLPYKFSDKFDKTSGYKTQSVFTVPLKTKKKDILGILQIINAMDEDNNIIPFSKEDEKMLLHFASIAVVALERTQLTRAIFHRTIRMTQMHDQQETWGHVNRVGGYSVEIYDEWAKRHNLATEELTRKKDLLRMAAMLHDVGKIAISDLILKKPGKFDYNEYEIMKQHTILGARIFCDIESDFDETAFQVALNHHERWDGKGYPGHIDVKTGLPLEGYKLSNGQARGKEKDEIPLFGRIVAVADVYDALSSERIYKEAWDEDSTLAEIKKGSGTQFDPEIVDLFFYRIKSIQAIKEKYKGNKPFF